MLVCNENIQSSECEWSGICLITFFFLLIRFISNIALMRVCLVSYRYLTTRWKKMLLKFQCVNYLDVMFVGQIFTLLAPQIPTTTEKKTMEYKRINKTRGIKCEYIHTSEWCIRILSSLIYGTMALNRMQNLLGMMIMFYK